MKKTRDEVFKKKIQERIEKYLRLFEEQEEQGAIWNVKLEGQFVKNKKPKTKPLNIVLFELVAKAMIGYDSVVIEQTEKQIKQLIADEVIGEDDGEFEEIDLFGENGEKVTLITRSRADGLREQQRKKLERL